MTFHSKGYDEEFGSYKIVSKIETPKYYDGANGYTAREVVENFDLNYNLGTAITYLLRAGKKAGNPMVQDIRKAINHLHFELDRIHNDNI